MANNMENYLNKRIHELNNRKYSIERFINSSKESLALYEADLNNIVAEIKEVEDLKKQHEITNQLYVVHEDGSMKRFE